MARMTRVVCAAALVALGGSGCAMGLPCDNIDRTVAPAEKLAFGAAITRQLGVAHVDVLESLQFGTWRVLYVDSHVADEAFLFYSADPRSSRYVTLWSGAATPDEETSVQKWVGAHAPGIPSSLAACFAWHVTKDPNR